MLEERINRDLKAALLAKDTLAVNTLRGLKSAILYAKVAGGNRTEIMPEAALLVILQKEAKKRQESIEAYRHAGNEERAKAEAQEKEIIERYLPAQLSEDEVGLLVDEAIHELGGPAQAKMGEVVNAVRQKAAAAADGALIARLTRERLNP